MESDISELMKKEKPSLIGLMTKRGGDGAGVVIDGRKGWRVPWFSVGITMGILAAVLVSGFFAYNYFLVAEEEPVEKAEKKSTAYVSFDEEESVVLKSKEEFSPKTNEIAIDGARFGTLKKLNIKLSDGEIKDATFKDLLKIWEAAPPSDLEFIVLPETQEFLYYSDARTAMAAVFKVSDTNRALSDMLSWEARIPSELNEFLLGAKPEINIVFFEDKTHGGISYRFAKMSFSEDLGFGYFVFPEKKNLVIASSEEVIRIIINRLLEP